MLSPHVGLRMPVKAGYDGGLASEWLPVRTPPRAVSLALGH
jgi:hypothetical protein